MQANRRVLFTDVFSRVSTHSLPTEYIRKKARLRDRGACVDYKCNYTSLMDAIWVSSLPTTSASSAMRDRLS
jgi:hypothetical protein